MNQIILHEMSKSFGKKNVIKAQNACFSPGQIYGIVGQNGCGKTVLFKCMSGLMPTTSGRIEIQLDDPAQKARPYCGVVIDGAGFNDSLSGLSNLVALADITKKADKKAIASLMASVGLSPDNRKKVRYYSLGMRQRLAIAQAIMEDPAILLLDEPLNGLDYEGVKTVYDILKVQKERRTSACSATRCIGSRMAFWSGLRTYPNTRGLKRNGSKTKKRIEELQAFSNSTKLALYDLHV